MARRHSSIRDMQKEFFSKFFFSKTQSITIRSLTQRFLRWRKQITSEQQESWIFVVVLPWSLSPCSVQISTAYSHCRHYLPQWKSSTRRKTLMHWQRQLREQTYYETSPATCGRVFGTMRTMVGLRMATTVFPAIAICVTRS